MNFAVSVYGDPWSGSAAWSALQFCEAAIAGGHRILRVFFYHSAVLLANDYAIEPSELPDLKARWAELAQRHNVELAVCVAAAVRRGVLDPHEAKRMNRTGANLAPGFTAVGLGQLIAAVAEADRSITFGGAR